MADIIGKRSGFNYSQRWGSQLGQTGGFQLGSRPVPEGDWNEMTDEEKLATMGTTDGQFLDQAHESYQRRNRPGGDIYNENARAYEAISQAAPTDFAGVERALLDAGFDPSIHANGPLFKQLAQIWNGVPLVNTAAQQPQNRSAQFSRGLAGIQEYLPGGAEEQLLRRWHSSGTKELQPLPGGNYTDGVGNYYDRFGFNIDPQTGQRTGGNYLNDPAVGSTLEQAYQGGQQRGVLGSQTGPINTTPLTQGTSPAPVATPYSSPTAWGGGWGDQKPSSTRPPESTGTSPGISGKPFTIEPSPTEPLGPPTPRPQRTSTRQRPAGMYGIYG